MLVERSPALDRQRYSDYKPWERSGSVRDRYDFAPIHPSSQDPPIAETY